MARIEVLLVEDSQSDALIIQSLLRRDERFSVAHVETLQKAFDYLDNSTPDVVILDLTLPDSTGLATFESLLPRSVAPIVILSGIEDESTAIAAVSLGAEDYVPKSNLNHDVLSRSILYAIERYARQNAERRTLQLEHEIEFAGQIQSHLLPSTSPCLPGFDIAGICNPAELCCGDFFDFIEDVKEDELDIVIADVSGHGFGPAMVMVGTRRILRSAARSVDSLPQVMSIIDRAVLEDTLPDQFVTLFYLRLNYAARTIRYSAAGHHAAVLHRDGSVCPLDQCGLPLGITPDGGHEVSEPTRLLDGDIVVLMTDGVWEAASPNGAYFGRDRVYSFIHDQRDRSAQQIVESLTREIEEFSCVSRPSDDVTIVLVKDTRESS